ncbi:Salicylic acid-binding protein 2 [Sesamum alatum]|uniref:Salicylic acid-binding protein 2 n=1 Tax=Sesamum alatum TaxID=300844 RepID=A0AAE1XQL0_9LAMI|nr:Salicylic acid-binding protein 2 [Sesamum alatum]
MAGDKQQVHIILVHGACHGAWCWYKLKPLLEAAGHRVTALDLAASGIDRRSLEELHTFADYSQPLLELMASIPPEEKVVLVGHSLGGMNLAFAMDMYPEKIKVAVFLTAVMPDSTHKPSYVMEQSVEVKTEDDWSDAEFKPYGHPEKNLTSVFFGPEFIATKLYDKCPPEDIELAKMLSRPCCFFVDDLSKKSPFSEKGYGSVKRVFIIVPEDKAVLPHFQRWQIETCGAHQVKEIHDADHMVMLSKPKELCQCLLEIIAECDEA